MNYDLLSLVLFFCLLYAFYLRHKEKFIVQAKIIFLYKTKIGLKFMDSVARKFPRAVNVFGFAGIVTGFAGMATVFVFLAKETIDYLVVPSQVAPLAPVLPGISIPGVPYLSFWHWIISIFLVAIIHEGSHGILARYANIKIKSSGFAFVGPQLAAFVEPEEKSLNKSSYYRQLAVFAAGPFSNIIAGLLLFLLLIFVLAPAYSNVFEVTGINITNITLGYPLQAAGLEAPFIITSINGMKLNSTDALLNVSSGIKAGDIVRIETGSGAYSVTAVNNTNSTKGYLGVGEFSMVVAAKERFMWIKPFLPAIRWINMLIAWLFMINIGIALFNLLPFGPVDGGRMFYTAMLAIFKHEKKAKRIWGFFSAICLILIFINLLPWIIKLLSFLVTKVLWLVSLV
ncbi:MAG TPA: hypothetical protein HA362_03025 [Nanoarchaeota archaeon]|nr:hypothetical protein [Nanoarchaeota archaeon]